MKGKCEICNKVNYLHKHHITSKCFKGSNSKYNLCKICLDCHEKVHRGEIIIEGKFLTFQGYELIYRNKEDLPITDRTSKVFIK